MQFDRSRRRALVALLGAMAAWPLAARAQQTGRVRRIGYISPGPAGSPRNMKWSAEFERALGALGWTIGRDLHVDYRWGAIDPKLREQYARELTALAPEAVLAVTPAVAVAVQHEAPTVPVVFLDGTESAVRGLVANWSHPGGTLTGFVNFVDSIFGKWLQLLKEISPAIDRVAYLFNPETMVPGSTAIGDLESAAQFLEVEIVAAPVRDDAEIEAAVGALAAGRRGGAIVLPGPFIANHQEPMFAAANRSGVPVIYPFRYYVENGGLLSYGVDESDLYRGGASYIDRILKGADPGELPVQAPAKFELAVNTKAAKAIAFEMPASIMNRADAVIE